MKISVIIASYNYAQYIEEAINSVIHQTYSDWELIIADDGSDDATKELIGQFQESTHLTLRYLSQQNKGPGAARNLGMENAIGDYFIFIDSDCTVDKNWLAEIDNVVRNVEVDSKPVPAAHTS